MEKYKSIKIQIDSSLGEEDWNGLGKEFKNISINNSNLLEYLIEINQFVQNTNWKFDADGIDCHLYISYYLNGEESQFLEDELESLKEVRNGKGS